MFVSRSSGTLLKNLFSFTDPVGPPSALAPLSEMNMIKVLLELSDLREEVDEPADVMIGVLNESGEHFHHSGVELPFLRRQ